MDIRGSLDSRALLLTYARGFRLFGWSKGRDFASPVIKIRGKGTNGQIESSIDYSIVNSIVAPIVIAVIFTLLGSTFIQTIFLNDNSDQKKIIEGLNEFKTTLKTDSLSNILIKQRAELDSLITLREMGAPEREDNIFITFNKSGLSDLFPKYISTVSETTYRNTAYFLFHNYLINPGRKDNYIIALENLGQIEGIVNTSKGTIYYLLYKIYNEQQDNKNAMKAIKNCEQVAPLLYVELMENDKYYDVGKLRKKFQMSK